MKWTWRGVPPPKSCLLRPGRACWQGRGSPPSLPSPQRGGPEIRDPLTQCWMGSREDTETHQEAVPPGAAEWAWLSQALGEGSPPTHTHINGRAPEPRSAQVQEPGAVGGAGMNPKTSSLGVCTGDQAHSAALIALHTHPVPPSHIRKQEKQTQKQLQTSFLGDICDESGREKGTLKWLLNGKSLHRGPPRSVFQCEGWLQGDPGATHRAVRGPSRSPAPGTTPHSVLRLSPARHTANGSALSLSNHVLPCDSASEQL